MASAILKDCPFQKPDDICKWLRDQIHKKVLQQKSQTGVRGLKERIMDQVYGSNGPGSPSWQTHDDEITNNRDNIRKYVDEHRDRGCGDRFPISQGVKDWLKVPNPKPQEWKGPVVKIEPARFSWEWWEATTGLTGAALVVYLIVFEGSRLFPPRNAIPVP